jgi:CRISPR system Cascade subunit CasE
MFLSRLTLNARSREARRDLGDVYQLHRTIMAAFKQVPDSPARESLEVLFRLESRGPLPIVLVQSRYEPRWELPAGYLAPGTDPECKPIGHILDAIKAGGTYRFRLLANPTRKIARFDETGARQRQGKRVDLRRDDDRVAWLERKGTQHGFQLARVGDAGNLDVLVRSSGRHVGRRDGARVTVAGAQFDGRLVVENADRVRAAIARGVGPGKAFGFGLLTLARDR